MKRCLFAVLPLLAAMPAPSAAAQDRPLGETCPKLPAAERAEIERVGGDRSQYAELTWYARAYCVSLAEARRRMDIQNRDAIGPETEPGGLPLPPPDSIGTIAHRVEANEAATFAGLWIQHQPDYRVVVAFTRDAAATLRKYTSDPLFKPLDRPGPTQAELRATQDRLYRDLERYGARPVSAGAYVVDARVEVEVVGDMAPFRAAIARGEISHPPWVVIHEPRPIARPPVAPPPPGRNPVKAFPRSKYRSGGPQPAILITGKVVLEDGCLRLDEERRKRVIVWNNEAALDLHSAPGEVRIVDRDSGVAIAPGETVTFGGGSGPLTDETMIEDADPACPGPYYLVAGFGRIEPIEEGRLQGRANELQHALGIPAADALYRARGERAREIELSALADTLRARAPDGYAGHWTHHGRMTLRFARTPDAEVLELIPAALQPYITTERVPRPLAELKAEKNALLDQIEAAGIAATAGEMIETGEITLHLADLPALNRAAVEGRVRFPPSVRIATDGALPVGGYGEAKTQAANRALEAAPDFAELRALVAATPVPGRLVTGQDGPDRPMSRAASLDTTRFLIAYGFTTREVEALRRQGLDAVRAFLDQNGGATATNRAILAREVLVGEVVEVRNELLGDGFRSTARLRVAEPLKGGLAEGAEVAVRLMSGRDPDGSFHQSNDEPMLLPGLPGALAPGSRWVTYLSEGLLRHQARLAGGQAPASRAFVPVFGMWQVDGERIAARYGEPMPLTLAGLRDLLAPVDRAADAAYASVQE